MDVLLLFCSFLLSFVMIVNAYVTDYGYPRCYTSFVSYDSAFIENNSTTAFIRPLIGQSRFPYEGGTTKEECDALVPPLISLGPHWSPLGLTRYVQPQQDDCNHCLPAEFNQKLIVVSHGSWNRNPFIGYNLHAYNLSFSEELEEYEVLGQQQLLPPMRHSRTGIRLRPVDVRTYPGDGALLMTADRDDTYPDNSRGGGLYRIRKNNGEVSSNDNAVAISLGDLNVIGENPGDVVLERLLPISCARQISVSPNNPRLLYISTYGGFCPDRSAGDKIWVVELDAADSYVTRASVLIDNLRGPQGIDAFGTSLYIATQGNSVSQRGNCVLEIENVEEYVEALFNGTQKTPSMTNTTEIICGFTRIQRSHSWRSLRVHSSGMYAVVSIGADCNWPCEDDVSNNDLQTTLVRVDLVGDSRGNVSMVAKGIRNSIGLWFDPENSDYLFFTSFGSDRAAGIPNATSANDVPDCTVEVLKLEEPRPTTPPTLMTPTPTPETPFPPSLCFSGTNTVTVQRKGLISMEDLHIGDMVLGGNHEYTQVYSFGHYHPNLTANYLQIHYRSPSNGAKEKVLEVSSNHMIYMVDKNNRETMPVPASRLEVGDYLMTNTADDDVVALVTKIASTKGHGAYAPFTTSGNLIVSGILVSNYIAMLPSNNLDSEFQHWIAHKWNSPHRWICTSINFSICLNEKYMNDGLSPWIYYPYHIIQYFLQYQVQVIILLIILISTQLSIVLSARKRPVL